MRVRPHPTNRGLLRRRAHGMSLVELLVGVAVGMLVTAAATTALVAQVRESRQLLLEARLMQDLRTAADLLGRGLRRAGYWGDATAGLRGTSGAVPAANPYVALAPAAAASDAVSFRFSRDAVENNLVDGNEQLGYRLRNGAVEMLMGAGGWQAVTDATTLVVTELTVTPRVQEVDLQPLCARPCPAGSTLCPPRQQVRSVALRIAGRAAHDARVERALDHHVRLRNDVVVGACAV
jgi:prepilin peptidase dependent protein B